MKSRQQTGVTIILGIGNRLGGDDAVGALLVDLVNRGLKSPSGGRRRAKGVSKQIMAVDAGTTPEAYSSVIRGRRPDLLILVDAADMGLLPGVLRVIPRERIRTVSFSTHSMPLSIFMGFAEDLCKQVVFVGVQPERAQIGTGISEAVRTSAKELSEIILEGRIEQIPLLEQMN